MENKALRQEYLSRFFMRNRLAYFAMLLSAILFGALNLAVTWLMQQLVDNVSEVQGALPLRVLALLTVGIILLILPLKALNYFSEPRFMKKALTQFRCFAFEKLTGKSIASFQNEATSVYLSAFSNDLTVIETNYLEKQRILVFNTVWTCGAIALMLAYSPVLAVIAVVLCAMPLLASSFTGKHMEKAEKAVSERNAGFVASLKDILSGFSVIKSFWAENAAINLLKQSSAAVERAKCRKRKLTVILSTIGGIAGISAQLGTFLVGAVLAQQGFGITPGILFVFVNLTGAVITSVQEMPGLLANRRAALSLIDKMAASLEANVHDEGVDIPNHLENGISIRNLCFGYGWAMRYCMILT